MATRGQKIKLLVFLLGVAALVVGFAIMLGPSAFWRESDDYLVLVPTTVAGLEDGSPVTLRGVPVGTVTSMQPVADAFVGVRVWLKVRGGAKIKADDKAFLQYQGVTGLKVVDISGGTPSSDFLKPGAQIPYGRGIIDDLAEQAPRLADEVSELLGATRQLVSHMVRLSEKVTEKEIGDLVGRTASMLTRLDRASGNLEDATQEVARRLPATLDRTQVSLRSLESTFESVRPTVESAERTMVTVEQAALEARAAVGNLGAALGTIEQLVANNDDELTATIKNVRQASQSLEVLTRQLRQRPSRLLFARPPREREVK